ncbi:MAG: topoisomerase DNA-binding C4 zinc finger domain-containing protein, partial [Candidatus Hodarchaeales archaeon]
ITSSNIVLRSMTENHEAGILTWESEVVEDAIGYLTHLQNTLHNPILSRSDERFPPDKKPLQKIVTKILRRKKAEMKKPDFETCPKCGKKLVKREGKTGSFWGCTGYPDCHYTRNIEWKK